MTATTHTCPGCNATLHTNGPLEAWITPDGRVFVEADTSRPTEQRWLELPPSAQNWLAEVFRLARDQVLEANAARIAG